MKPIYTLPFFIFVLHPSLSMSAKTEIITENGTEIIIEEDTEVIIENERGTTVFQKQGVNTPIDADQNTIAHQIIKHGGGREGLLPSMDLGLPNKYGETPFTLWLMYNTNPEDMDTLKFIYEKNPEVIYLQDTHGRTNLLVGLKHTNSIKVIQFVYGLHPQALFIPDNDSNLPLHYAFQYNNSEEVTNFIYQQNPSALQTPNKKGETPLDYAFKYRGEAEAVRLIHTLNPLVLRTLKLNGNGERLPLNHNFQNKNNTEASLSRNKKNGNKKSGSFRKPKPCQSHFFHARR